MYEQLGIDLSTIKYYLEMIFFSIFRDLKERRDAYIKRLNDIYFNNLKKSEVQLIRGQGKFVDKNKVAVGDEIYSADHILVAVGGYKHSSLWDNAPNYFSLVHCSKENYTLKI